MSSYLSIYLQPKGSDKKLLLDSWSRNNDIYQRFNEEGVVYIGNDDTPKYTEITSRFLQGIQSDLTEEIDRVRKRISLYKENSKGNLETLDEILNQEEFLDELNSERYIITVLSGIVTTMDDGYSDFSGMYANID